MAYAKTDVDGWQVGRSVSKSRRESTNVIGVLSICKDVTQEFVFFLCLEAEDCMCTFRQCVTSCQLTTTGSDVAVGNTTAEATEQALTLKSNLM